MYSHLKQRWFDVSKYPNVVVTDEDVTFPLFNTSGKMIGYQKYNPSLPKLRGNDPKLMRYFTWVTKAAVGAPSELAVWGLETVHWDDRILFVTEGVFDACRLHWYGLPAIAVLSNNPAHLASWLRTTPSLKIACVQGDTAGVELAKYGDKQIWLPTNKDVGNLTAEEFVEHFAEWYKTWDWRNWYMQ